MSSSITSLSHHSQPDLLITIECHITQGLPSVIIVGFANRSIDEAKERLRAAFHASKLKFPPKRITINLAPADIPKDGTAFDLGIAAAIMQANGDITDVPKAVWIGELGLNGDVRAVRGIIGKLVAAQAAGFNQFFIPTANLQQAQLVPGLTFIPVPNLAALHAHLTGIVNLEPVISTGQATGMPGVERSSRPDSDQDNPRIEDIGGHESAKRILEIAAAGGHNMLFSGPPGTGKSMLARAFSSILPPLGQEETLEVTHIHSLASQHFDRIVTERPFRAPHHSASLAALIGGGAQARPGEVSLAHRGVLFLDELPEYHRNTIEALRQPLEDKRITIARAQQHADYAADFILVATCNPCPCGFYGSSEPCVCQPYQVMQYQRRLSGPLLDRIDLYADVSAVKHATLLKTEALETSRTILSRVMAARKLQASRLNTASRTNAGLSNRELKQFARLDKQASNLLNQAASQLHLSARAYMRTLKVARTIADLADSTSVGIEHIAEAIQYRRPTRPI